MVLVLDYTSLVYFDSEINLESVSLTNQFWMMRASYIRK